MKVNEAFKLRVYELCKVQGISFTKLCKNIKLKRNRVFVENRGLNIVVLKKICDG